MSCDHARGLPPTRRHLRFRPRHSVVFTSEALLAAEDRLLARAEDLSAPEVDLAVIERVTRKETLLSAEQSETLGAIAVSGRQVDLLVGPAGAGKTTAMHALKTGGRRPTERAAWSASPRAQSRRRCWPRIWASVARTPRSGFTSSTVDGRSSAGSARHHRRGHPRRHLTLDRLTALAAEAGAKVLLVGDWAQLQSVDAGGAFSLLASARPDTPS